jgi:hypothetical protein
MGESTFEVMTWARSMQLDPEEALAGATTISLETTPGIEEIDVIACVENDFPAFLIALRCLSERDQDLLLGYYVLAKTQKQLGLILQSDQTRASQHIREALKKMGHFMMGEVPAAPVKKTGRLPRHQTLQGQTMTFRDPAVLGQFRIAVEEPGFKKVFTEYPRYY